MAKKLDPERLKQFVRHEAAAYLDRPNVTSVGIGYKTKDGKRTRELSIQFSVSRKLQPEALASAGVEPIPRSFIIDGVEVATDVVERTFKPSYRLVTPERVEKDQRKSRLDPLLPGCSVAHVKGSAGTLGCIVFDLNDGAACMLSNWHVLHGPEGQIGETVVQPGPHDDNRTLGNHAGTLVRSHLGAAGDCAIARIERRGHSPRSSSWAAAASRRLPCPTSTTT